MMLIFSGGFLSHPLTCLFCHFAGYASSACIYPEYKQLDENLDGASGLKEDDAWPAQPQAPRPSPVPSAPP